MYSLNNFWLINWLFACGQSDVSDTPTENIEPIISMSDLSDLDCVLVDHIITPEKCGEGEYFDGDNYSVVRPCGGELSLRTWGESSEEGVPRLVIFAQDAGNLRLWPVEAVTENIVASPEGIDDSAYQIDTTGHGFAGPGQVLRDFILNPENGDLGDYADQTLSETFSLYIADHENNLSQPITVDYTNGCDGL